MMYLKEAQDLYLHKKGIFINLHSLRKNDTAIAKVSLRNKRTIYPETKEELTDFLNVNHHSLIRNVGLAKNHSHLQLLQKIAHVKKHDLSQFVLCPSPQNYFSFQCRVRNQNPILPDGCWRGGMRPTEFRQGSEISVFHRDLSRQAEFVFYGLDIIGYTAYVKSTDQIDFILNLPKDPLEWPEGC